MGDFFQDGAFIGISDDGRVGIVIDSSTLISRHSMTIGVGVNCTFHGPMKRRDAMCRFECVGFDGEGCTAQLTDEDMHTIIAGRPVDVTNRSILTERSVFGTKIEVKPSEPE